MKDCFQKAQEQKKANYRLISLRRKQKCKSFQLMKMSRTINFKPKCKKEQTRSVSSFDQTQEKN